MISDKRNHARAMQLIYRVTVKAATQAEIDELWAFWVGLVMRGESKAAILLANRYWLAKYDYAVSGD